MKIAAILIPIWLALAFVNSGFIYASFYGQFGHDKWFDDREARENAAFSVGMSLNPAVWLMTPFMTGFYYDGWMFPGSRR